MDWLAFRRLVRRRRDENFAGRGVLALIVLECQR
jgi:hypothetical protein